ncbi:MAG TPA: VanZ family protein [Phenylobacterium sp.]|jgi:VanZ family protein|uniref:VanZ family protein n=1 Tax=Phenylobacterium sp. TaxID=1871053 RepID=UPI002CD9074E|nr:VanZ family protein [Phenylobacterium sp.]HXA38123.1 VanZ family protein [Phenylobacterium sp.]
MTPFDRLRRLPRPYRLAIFALACVILLYLTLAPGKDVPGVGLVWDKAEHAIAWAVLTGAGLLLSTRRRWAILVFAFVFGAAVEVLQATLPFGRDGDIFDLTADTVGIAAAYVVWRVWRRLGWVR